MFKRFYRSKQTIDNRRGNKVIVKISVVIFFLGEEVFLSFIFEGNHNSPSHRGRVFKSFSIPILLELFKV